MRYFKSPKVPIRCQFLANWYVNAYLKTDVQRLKRQENKSKAGIVNNLKVYLFCPKIEKLQQESENIEFTDTIYSMVTVDKMFAKKAGIGQLILVPLRLENWVARLGKIGKAITILTEYPK